MAKAAPQPDELSTFHGRVLDHTASAQRSMRAPEERFVTHSGVAASDQRAAAEVETRLSGVTTFVSTLAHEIRQPLSVLLASIGVVCQTRDPELAAHAAEIMKRQVRLMDRLVEDVLDATRWAHGTVVLHKQRLDVRDVIRSAALDMAASVADRHHRLVIDSGEEPLWVDADVDRLHQMLSNLLRNAVKYTDPGGRIRIIAVRQAATLTLCVRDTGRGIERGALTGIFDLFARVQPTDATGLGIGLGVVREIAALHGGHVEALSDGPGRGSEFIVTLPLAPASVRA